ncbi:hypothetical protein [Weissella soli]|uniref:hypothetical protein n=2 Tax=Weissella soli TaxID=155866 RepID=UPI00359FB070
MPDEKTAVVPVELELELDALALLAAELLLANDADFALATDSDFAFASEADAAFFSEDAFWAAFFSDLVTLSTLLIEVVVLADDSAEIAVVLLGLLSSCK